MIKKIMITICTTIALSGCGKQLPTLIPLDKIVAFGDSLTAGYGVDPDKNYPYKLKEITGYNVVNEGKSGDRAKVAKDRLLKVIDYHKPAVIIISIGGNDMLIGHAQTLKEDLKELVDITKNAGAIPILVAQPQPSIGTLKDAVVYKEVASENEVFLVSNLFSKYLAKKEYKLDPIHLNEKGYEVFTEDLAKKLKKSGLFKY